MCSNARFIERGSSFLETLLYYALTVSKFLVCVFSVSVIVRCLRSMLSEGYAPETWAAIRAGRETIPINHWENIIGRAHSADIRIKNEAVSRAQAVLTRSDNGRWMLYDIFSRGKVWVNGEKVGFGGMEIYDSDYLNFSGVCVRFVEYSAEKRQKLEEARPSAGHRVSQGFTLVELTIFQLSLLLQHSISAADSNILAVLISFGALIILEWSIFNAMHFINRSGFEIETLAFYLSSLGMSVAASSTPNDMYKQILLTFAGIVLFLTLGWWLRNLKRTSVMRKPIAVLSLILLCANLATSEVVFGAKNWMEIGGFSFQPSEFVKVGYIYVGAATLDKLYGRRNLYVYIGFSATCVLALALMGDYGTALIFFVTFLVISFMRSGSLATVVLAVSGAGLAGLLAVSIKPYIAQRFANWGHVWEDVYKTGFQQTRAMSAAAAGGLFGKGAGAGWLKDVFAANTDMVFAVVCEELGLITGICSIAAIVALAFFAFRSSSHARSAFYSISACASVSMLLVQLALNVFGSLDILPFTGVTFPFVSRGGTSLLCCWMLMAYIKSADNRRNASFAVRPADAYKVREPVPEYAPESEEDYGEEDE